MIEVLKHVLEALEQIDRAMPFPVGKQSISDLRQAIADLKKQEPCKPLTDEQIDRAMPFWIDTIQDFKDGVRYAEAAHGIKE
jgi:hypothetical protein